ncbi:Nucleotidyl transferase AbiEii toxin, Type IV TA system [Rhizobium mongolense subsp. loessense]|uniref:Nucleotidyl transferase AbiEii toxin, Type IV TA system n=1 Tax=Rhizobium mongolense subsp. loessense TaxID=158890 RepID=A0A1G4U7U6_9HYPH|nr:nucleotidyl transferase AbiEii/AbiGii toxin family protein [Rhizobium mongolense]SCW89637.1 Nucleotidyl transferase AbiEii toxin, Type IV TA system [Rhizobium mongolense subsp. loessense]
MSSFVAEANRAEAEAIDVKCVRLVETAADKFVALARRAGFAFSGLGPLDHTLVRHVYDLSRMDGHYDLDAAVAIALETMKAEAAARAGDYPAYKEDPKAETLRTYKIMAAKRNLPRDMRNYSVISSTVRGLISRRHSKRRNDSPNGSITHKRLILEAFISLIISIAGGKEGILLLWSA